MSASYPGQEQEHSEKNKKKVCVHPFKFLHWVDDIVFCNKCNTTLVKNK